MNNKSYEISLWDDVVRYVISPNPITEENSLGTTFIFREEDTPEEEVIFTYITEPSEMAGSIHVTQTNYTLTVESLEGLDDIYPDGYVIVSQYPYEKKIGVIGSNTITAQHQSFNEKIVSNVNGQNTLTFSIYQKFIDNETGEVTENPFLKLLTNERKVKLRLGDKDDIRGIQWYDFIIKNISESSESKVFTYTCGDLFVNELSKTGFNITLDAKLENNIGTPAELAGNVLDGTDWEVSPNSELIHTFSEEPLYQIKISGGSEIVLEPVVYLPSDEESYTLTNTTNFELYGFYSTISGKKETIQVLCPVDEGGSPVSSDIDSIWEVDETSSVIASEHIENSNIRQFVINNVIYENSTPLFAESIQLSNNYRGRRIVRSQVTKFDANLEKYVSKYLALDEKGNPIKDDVYWGFASSDVGELTVLHNYVTNSENFTHTKGWEVVAESDVTNPIEIGFTSSYTSGAIINQDGKFVDGEETEIVKSYLTFDVKDTTQRVYNSGLWDYLYDYDKINIGDKFILRFKQVEKVAGADVTFSDENIIPQISFFSTKWIDTKEEIFEAIEVDSSNKVLYNKNYTTYELTCKIGKTHDEIVAGYLGLCFQFPSKGIYGIEQVELFKEVLLTAPAESGEAEITENISTAADFLKPGEYHNKPLVAPIYRVYKDGASEKKTLDSISYVLETKDVEELNKKFSPYFDPQSAARIQISASQSNRFNILQDIAEASQCWIRFTINHNNNTGRIEPIVTNHADGTQTISSPKQVSFHKFVGKKNFAGFKYGINLKSIQRTIESNQLTTKLIVKRNSNEFAENKQCAIGKAPSNVTKEDTIYNFDYYLKQGMLSEKALMEDLYGEDGFYNYLKEKNAEVGRKSDQVEYYSILLNDMQAELTIYSNLRSEAISKRKELISDILAISKIEYNTYIEGIKSGTINIVDPNDETKKQTGLPTTIQGLYNKCVKDSLIFPAGSWESWFTDGPSIKDKLIAIQTYNAQIINANQILYNSKTDPEDIDSLTEGLEYDFKQASEKYEELKEELKLLQKEKLDKEKEFYEKYSRYIQEGTWISEDFYDNELYYLEALNVSSISAMPKISYTINVIDVSKIDGLENIDFNVGDQSYIQDTEFFGYIKKSPDSDMLTPYSEEVVCTEVTRVLKDPKSNTIKIQNYKNQFEDLFQRITATSQQVQYKSGEYQKAANAFTENGDIKPASLQDALTNNKLMLKNATDQSVTWGSDGITTVDLKQPNLLTRIIGGAVMVSNDGGDTWGHAITGNGMNANFLTAGKISVGEVTIETGDQTSFRWNKLGISAYKFITDDKGNIEYDPYTFVRHDSFGLYGISGNKNFVAKREEDIWAEESGARFGLTWKGFFLHSDDGAVQITSDKQIQVFNGRPREDEEGNYTNLKIQIGKIGSKISDEGEVKDIYGLSIYNDEQKAVIKQDENGNISIDGTIIAREGKIGGWEIKENGFLSINETFLGKVGMSSDSTYPAFWAGNNEYNGGPTQASELDSTKFYVTHDGYLHSISGDIGGWKIGTTALTSKESDTSYGKVGMSSNTSYPAFWAGSDANGGPTQPSERELTKFYVTHDGYLYATEGNIGGCIISNGELQINASHITDGTIDKARIKELEVGKKFSVSTSGILKASGADIEGILTAGAGSKIGPFVVENNRIYIKDYGESQFGSGIFRTQSDYAGIEVNATEANQSHLFWVYCSEVQNSSGVNYKRCGIQIVPTVTSGKLELHFGNEGLKMESIPNSTTETRTVMTGQWELLNDYSGNNTFCGMMISPSNNNERTWIRTLGTYVDGTETYCKGLDLSADNSFNDLKGNWFTAGDIINGSDARLKNTIQIFSDNYDIFFDNLTPVTFKYNENQSNRLHSGFIAQQIVESLESAGLTTQDFAAVCSRDPSDPEAHWGVRYGEFVSLNTWQIQKLKSRVSELESELSTLKQKFETFSNL